MKCYPFTVPQDFACDLSSYQEAHVLFSNLEFPRKVLVCLSTLRKRETKSAKLILFTSQSGYWKSENTFQN